MLNPSLLVSTLVDSKPLLVHANTAAITIPLHVNLLEGVV